MSLILNNDDVRQALSLEECLSACESAYRDLAGGQAVNRPTTQTYLPHALSRASYCFKSVEGGVLSLGVMALRISSDIVREEEMSGTLRLNKVPLAAGKYVGLIQLYSTETGELLGIMPDGLVQQMRVGVTSALGVRYLAREDATTLALIGTGDQARAHLGALLAVRPFSEVRVFSPNPEHRAEFVRTMQEGCKAAIRPVATVGEAVAGCDVICTATNASRPIITGDLLEPGVHYNAIREFEHDEAVFEKSDIVVIHTRFGGAFHHMPPGQTKDMPGLRREKPRDWSRYPEIGELLSGQVPGRSSDRQITFFLNNIGTGVQFAAVGYSVLQGCRKLGLGHEVPTDWFLQDVKP